MHDSKETALRMYLTRGKAQALENARRHASDPTRDMHKLCDWAQVVQLLEEMK